MSWKIFCAAVLSFLPALLLVRGMDSLTSIQQVSFQLALLGMVIVLTWVIAKARKRGPFDKVGVRYFLYTFLVYRFLQVCMQIYFTFIPLSDRVGYEPVGDVSFLSHFGFLILLPDAYLGIQILMALDYSKGSGLMATFSGVVLYSLVYVIAFAVLATMFHIVHQFTVRLLRSASSSERDS